MKPLKMKAEVPEGEYLGKLTSVEEWKENVEKYGLGVRFAFEISKGDYAGQEICSWQAESRCRFMA